MDPPAGSKSNHLAGLVGLEPDPALIGHAGRYKAANGFRLPIPSKCEVCGGDFPSKTALKSHELEAHPKEPPFDDFLREKFLDLLRVGELPNKTARQLGISPHTVKRAMIVDPSFAEAVEMAESEAAEDVETVLRKRALAGDPWAVKEWLSKRSKDRWTDDKTLNINIRGEFTHRAELLPHENDILALQATVRERARLNGKPLPLDNPEITDAEIVE